MARPLRIEYPSAVYHVTSRGNERRAIFKDDGDRTGFLENLSAVVKRYNWFCHGYCLMNNHYHLLIETPDGNLALGMRQVNGVYTQAYNKRHKRVGHLFQGRYKAVLIQKDSHLLEVCRYVVLNPVRAKAVQKPENWPWSSYRATAGIKKPPEFLMTDWILGQFGNTKKRAQQAYKEFVRAGGSRIWDDLQGQSLLGEREFVEKMRPYVVDKRDIAEISKAERFVSRPELTDIFTPSVMADRVKRNRAIRDAVYKYGYKQSEIAGHLGMHFTSISRLLKMATNDMPRK